MGCRFVVSHQSRCVARLARHGYKFETHKAAPRSPGTAGPAGGTPKAVKGEIREPLRDSAAGAEVPQRLRMADRSSVGAGDERRHGTSRRTGSAEVAGCSARHGGTRLHGALLWARLW